MIEVKSRSDVSLDRRSDVSLDRRSDVSLDRHSDVTLDMVRQAAEGVKKRVTSKYYLDCIRKCEDPVELWAAAADQGLLGLYVPPELGGLGGGVTHVAAALQSLCETGVGLIGLILTNMTRSTIIKHGTEAQKQKYVVPTVNHKLRICFALTEADAGTNSFKIKSLASKLPGGGYRLNGQKTWISAFDITDYCMLVARTTPYDKVKDRREGISLFMMDTKSKGISKTQLDTGASMTDRQWTLFFDDVEIPAENLIGEEGKGLHCLFHVLNAERLLAAAQCIGIGEYVLAKAVEYAKTRAPFDKPIGSYQSVQHPMAYAKAHLAAAQLVLNKGLELIDSDQECGAESNIAKLLAHDAAMEAVNIALQTFGGTGLLWDTGVLHYLHYLKLLQVAPVNNQMVLNSIAERMLDLPKSY